MRRRDVLRTGAGVIAALGVGGLAGCTDLFETRSALEPPLVENRPDAAYFPIHTEGMSMASTTTAGPYTVGLTFSYPHRFWTVSGRETTQVEVASDDTLHLMGSVWDAETMTVLPTAEVTAAVTNDGEPVTERSLWAMLSQPMGYHFGDNVTLPGDGAYAVEMRVAPVGIRKTGAFAGKFGEGAAATMELEFARSALEEIPYTPLDEKQGLPGAVAPMEMGMLPISHVPAGADLTGRAVGKVTSGDATFVVTALDAPPAGVDEDGEYLLVSPRTPHNRYPLPFMALSATLERGGEATFDDTLVPAIDPTLGYHYGAVVPAIESGDVLRLTVDSPPQVARHEGYETAFLRMDDVELTAE